MSILNPELITIGHWVQFALVKSNNIIKFYKDGQQFGASIPYDETYLGSTPTKAGIGARYYNSHWHHNNLNGTIDDFRFFDGALDAVAIGLLFNNSCGTNSTLQEINYDGIYSPNDKIFDISNTFWLNATNSYCNEFGNPYYNTRPILKFYGQNYGNVYEYDFSL